MKKLLVTLLATILLVGTVFGTGCGKEITVDQTKTQLYVYVRDGGIGFEWLNNMKYAFEAKYADVPFETGKKGVEVVVAHDKQNIDLSSTTHNVLFLENPPYNSDANSGKLLDISDIVEESLSTMTDGKETGSIADKLTAQQQAALTALDGNYYVLPHFETYDGITYDRDVFEEYGLYFLERESGDTTSRFCDSDSFTDGVYDGEGVLSVGPDGVRGTIDDGLPSSYEEFALLLKQISKKPVIPFTWAGSEALESSYLTKLINGMWAAYQGYDEMQLCFTLNSNATTPATTSRTITSFVSGEPQIENKTITTDTGYYATAQVGKYYAYEMCSLVLSDESYKHQDTNTYDNLSAQRKFIYSNLQNQPIAMLIEGSFWYNEASDAFASSIVDFKDRAKNRRFSFMQLPRQVSGQVAEGQGSKNTLIDNLCSFAMINAKVANDPVKLDLSKKFLQFCYTDDSLIDFTKTTGVYKGVNYTMPSNVVSELEPYQQDIVEMKENSDIVRAYGDNVIFVNNQSPFFMYTSSMWHSLLSDGSHVTAKLQGANKMTAEDFFKGSVWDATKWADTYGAFYQTQA